MGAVSQHDVGGICVLKGEVHRCIAVLVKPLLEAGDGDHPSGASECWQVDPGERDCVGPLRRRHDPHLGFNMRKVTKGKVTIKMWDLGGQPRFRGMWERYCSNVSAIVYVVDGADHKNVDISREELHELIGKPSLKNIPLLVLGNKRDLPEALPEESIIERLQLKGITDREVGFYTISAKNQDNIETTIDWLIQHNGGK